jgi:TusA-related sulfurtransferase
MIEVDVRGYSRGIPTIRTQKAMKKYPEELLLVRVDTGWAKDDITRLGVNSGYAVKCERTDEGYSLELEPIA